MQLVTSETHIETLEASKIIGLSRQMVYALCAAGKLGQVRMQYGMYMIPRDAVEKYAASFVPRVRRGVYGRVFEIACGRCLKVFTVHFGHRNRKYCSAECSRLARSSKCKKPREERACQHCGLPFSIQRWSKVKFCSRKCSTDANRGKPNGRAKAANKVTRPHCHKYTVADGRKMLTHRYAMELILGRKLTSVEVVHHVDLDKSNEDPLNLCLMNDEQEHQLAHRSIDKLIRPLLLAGIIKFDGRAYILAR